MASQLKSSNRIWSLAQDLGLRLSLRDDPVREIVGYCERLIAAFLKKFPETHTLSELAEVAAASLGTRFEVIRSEADLQRVKQTYVARGERIFASLERELPDQVFGLTVRLVNREEWEPKYVSVIDCRGEKAAREFFTKWHEISHLLILTDQLRLSFQRTHVHSGAEQDPEERLVDVLAGRFGFYEPLIRPLASGRLSFEFAEGLRLRLCPEASREASFNGFVAAWPSPCILVRAELALKRSEERERAQGAFSFQNLPVPVLRAVRVGNNDAARQKGMLIPPRMRVPEISIINRLFEDEDASQQSDENLSWWKASDGTVLQDCPIRVEARRIWEGVEALIQPL